MPLNNFFKVNLPYGIKRNASDEWFVFNREYVPLGWNSKVNASAFNISQADESDTNKLPVYSKYKGLTDAAIQKIIKDPLRIQRDEKGKIKAAFFYYEGTDPTFNAANFKNYFAILKALSKFEISRRKH